MSTTVVATDLDRTLVYSPRAAGPADPTTLRTVEEHTGSTMTRVAEATLAALARAAWWVPATTRTVEQYRRLCLPGPRRFAVCAQGGVLLVDDAVDPAWAAHVRRLQARVASLDEVAALTADHLSVPVHGADGVFCWAAAEATPWLVAACRDRGWRLCESGRKLYALPAGLTKSAAVGEVVRRVGGRRLLAAGDALLDADLLDRADVAIHPAHGQLHALGWERDHAVTTVASGVGAGEEIAAWLLAHATRPGSGEARIVG